MWKLKEGSSHITTRLEGSPDWRPWSDRVTASELWSWSACCCSGRCHRTVERCPSRASQMWKCPLAHWSMTARSLETSSESGSAGLCWPQLQMSRRVKSHISAFPKKKSVFLVGGTTLASDQMTPSVLGRSISIFMVASVTQNHYILSLVLYCSLKKITTL